MKSKFFGFLLAALSFYSHGFEMRCKVTKVIDTNVFEESLSVDEYPDVVLRSENDENTLQIGSSVYSTSEIKSVQALTTVGFDKAYKIQINDVVDTFIDLTSTGPRGEIGVLEVNAKKVADLNCDVSSAKSPD